MYTKESALTHVEHALLAQPSTLPSIESMFDLPLLERIGAFQPHPESDDITTETLAWVAQLGFLTEENKDQVRAWATMNPFAHHGDRTRVRVSGENYGALYLMDDWVANDTQETHLDRNQKIYLFRLVMQLTAYLDQVAAGADPAALQYEIPQFSNAQAELSAFAEKTRTLFTSCWQSFLDACALADQEYAQEYAQILGEHIAEALKPQDETILKTLHLPEYMDTRRKVAGMKVGRKLIEMTTESFTALRALRQAHHQHPTPAILCVAERICQLEESLDDFGGLGNDVFSVSKEVFRDGTIFNFVALAVLSLAQAQDESSLNYLELQEQALSLTRSKIRELTEQFQLNLHGNSDQVENSHLFAHIDALTADDLQGDPDTVEEQKAQLKAYVTGLTQYFLATYRWEISPDGGLRRYQHEHAPFEQLRPSSKESYK